jgi:hypothetical protein
MKKNWFQRQIQGLDRFGLYVQVLWLLKRPGRGRFWSRESAALALVAAGIAALGLSALDISARGTPGLRSGVASAASEISPAQWRFWENSRIQTPEAPQGLAPRTQKSSRLPAAPARRKSRPRAPEEPWEWPASYGRLLLALAGMAGFGMVVSRILARGDAPSLLRFGNCCAMLVLFLYSAAVFLSTSTVTVRARSIGLLMMAFGGSLLLYGITKSYSWKELENFEPS